MASPRSMRLRTKLILAFLCCFLVPFVPAAAVIYLRTTGGLARIEGQVLGKACAGVQSDLANQQIEQVGALTASGQVQQLVARKNTAGLWRFLDALVNEHGFAQAAVVAGGRSTRTLAQVSLPETALRLSYSRSQASTHPTFAFQNYLGEVWLVTAQPIAADTAHGALLVCARQLDDATLAASAQRTGTQLSLYTGPVPARTATQLERVGFDNVASSLPFKQRVAALMIGVGAQSDAHGWTTTATGLNDAAGRPIAVATVAVPDVAFTSIRSSMTGAFLLALLLALGAATVAAALVSRTVARPLLGLVGAATAIAAGRTAPHLAVKGDDEVARAARAFNSMSRYVAQTVEGMSDQIQGLTQELSDLALVGETLTQSVNVKEALMPVAARLCETTASDFCGLHLLEGELAAPGLYSGYVPGSVQAFERLACRVLDSGKPLADKEIASDPVLRALAEQAAVSSLVAVPILYQGRRLGAISLGSHLAARYGPETVAVLSTVASQTATALVNAETYQQLERGYLQTVTALAAALEAKDLYTAEHAESLAEMANVVGAALGLDERRLRELPYAAVLHDIGKIAVPGTVLNKPGTLDDEEFALMAQHTVIGAQIVSRIDYLRPLAPVIRAAHERWDGRGYPDGLAGEAIPIEARIIFVCDAYHAMTSDRPYRLALPEDAARAELRAGAGSQFDPAVVEAFLATWPEGSAADQADEATVLVTSGSK